MIQQTSIAMPVWNRFLGRTEQLYTRCLSCTECGVIVYSSQPNSAPVSKAHDSYCKVRLLPQSWLTNIT